jgi:hypothetical protein
MTISFEGSQRRAWCYGCGVQPVRNFIAFVLRLIGWSSYRSTSAPRWDSWRSGRSSTPWLPSYTPAIGESGPILASESTHHRRARYWCPHHKDGCSRVIEMYSPLRPSSDQNLSEASEDSLAGLASQQTNSVRRLREYFRGSCERESVPPQASQNDSIFCTPRVEMTVFTTSEAT